MRVAALYDIHGNLPALEAVLAEVRNESVDRVVVGGDVIVGPMPRETLERLLDVSLPVQFIYGNAETAALQQMAGTTPARVPEPYRPAIAWTAEQVRDHRAMVASWPMTVRLQVDGLGDVLFCHATPRDEDECFTRLTPEDHLLPIFEDLDASVVVCGHTHMQFDRMIGHTRVLNAGSVGMPWGDPGADWLLLGPGVEFRHTDYDIASAAAQIRATTFPWPEDFAQRYILHPPSAAEMLDVYTRASRPR